MAEDKVISHVTRHLLLVVLLKVVLLLALYLFVMRAVERPASDAGATGTAVFGAEQHPTRSAQQ